MYNVNMNLNNTLTDKEIGFLLLASKCGKVLAYSSIYPNDIFPIAYRYLNNGCKSRKEYEYLVNFLIQIPDTRKELLK